MQSREIEAARQSNERGFNIAESTIDNIRNWIKGPGRSLVDLQTAKPENFKEAFSIRKQHEQFELKCMKYLSEYASLSEFRHEEPLNESIIAVDKEIQAFVNKVNKRTLLVVSYYTYFRVQDELWSLLDELEAVYKGANLTNKVSVKEALEYLDTGVKLSNAKIATISHELDRLKTILDGNEKQYLNNLEAAFAEVCQLTANAQQIMNLRKLVLNKEFRFLECEDRIKMTVAKIEGLSADLHLQFSKQCFGNSGLEAAELLNTYLQYAKSLQASYDECEQLFEAYRRMSVVDLRSMKNNVVKAKARLRKQYKSLFTQVDTFICLAEDSERFYSTADNLLEKVGRELVKDSLTPTGDTQRQQLDGWSEEWEALKRISLGLINNVSKNDMQCNVEDKIITNIRLKLYTLGIKLQEYECRVMGAASERFNCPEEMIPNWRRSQTTLLQQQRRGLARSVSQLAYSGDNNATKLSGSVPVLNRGGFRTPTANMENESPEKNINEYLKRFSHRLTNSEKTSVGNLKLNTLNEVERLLQNHEASRSLVEGEWRQLQGRLGNGMAMEEATRLYKAWEAEWTKQQNGLLKRKRLFERLRELDSDLEECRDQLDRLSDAACRQPAGGKITRQYLEELKVISEEIRDLKQTIPAQEQFINVLSSDVDAVFGTNTPESLVKVREIWTEYLQRLSEIEALLPNLIQGSELLASAEAFTANLETTLDGNQNDSAALFDIQQEANQLQERIEQHINKSTGLNSETDASQVHWLVGGLNAVIEPLQEAGEEAEVMAVNQNDRGGRSRSLSPSPRHQDSAVTPYNPTGGKPTAHAFESPDDTPLTDNAGFTTPLTNCQVYPGGNARLECRYHGFGPNPDVKWSYNPKQNWSVGDPRVANAFLATTSVVDSDYTAASLEIPHVLYKHAGEYTVEVSHFHTGESIRSSATLIVSPTVKRDLQDVTAVLGGKDGTLTGKDVELTMEFDGFDRMPSRVVWLHFGKPIDPTKWAVSVSPSATRITSDSLKAVDEGKYSCQVSDLEMGVILKSEANLVFQSALDVPRPASRSAARTPTSGFAGGSPSGGVRATMALDGSPLSLKCPLPTSAFTSYDRANEVRMRWFRDGIELYDSGPRNPGFFLDGEGGGGAEFQDGITFWKAGLADRKALVLTTNRIRSVDAGKYTCRIYIDKDVYESSGIVAVSSTPQFIERLTGAKVFLGEPITFRCRLEPWMPGDAQTDKTSVAWYHQNTLLTPDLQQRLGVRAETAEGECLLHISRASRRFAGLYRCEARSPLGKCETSCKLLIDQPVKPTLLGPIQCFKDEDDENATILRIEYDAVPRPQIHWLKDGEPIEESQGIRIIIRDEESLLRIENVQPEDDGHYSVDVINVAGNAEASLSVNFGDLSQDIVSPPSSRGSRTPARQSLDEDRQSIDSFINQPCFISPRSDSLVSGNVNFEIEDSIFEEDVVPKTRFQADRNAPSSQPPIFANPSSVALANDDDDDSARQRGSPSPDGRFIRSSTSVGDGKPPKPRNGNSADTGHKQLVLEPARRGESDSAFLLRPQSVSANRGESVAFSCLIRPPAGTPKISRVSWRHKNRDLLQQQIQQQKSSQERPRVSVVANEPTDGVFQLNIENLTEGDHGDYEVVALDEEDNEICSAKFHLSVDIDKDCNDDFNRCGGSRCNHRVRVNSTTTLDNPQQLRRFSTKPSEDGSRPDLGLEFKYKFDGGGVGGSPSKSISVAQDPINVILDRRGTASLQSGPRLYHVMSEGALETYSQDPRCQSTQKALLTRPRRPEGAGDTGHYQSLPDMFEIGVTHASTLLLEQFTLTGSSTRQLLADNRDDDDVSSHRGDFFLDGPNLPPSVSVEAGERLEISFLLSGHPTPQVFWFKDGSRLNDQLSSNDFQVSHRGQTCYLVIQQAREHHTGTWEVVARNLAGLFISSCRVNVIKPSAPNRRPSSALEMTSARPPLPASPSPPYLRRERRFSAQSVSMCSFSSPSERRARINLTRPNHPADKPPHFKRIFHDQRLVCGEDARFECILTGTPDPKVRWEFNGAELEHSKLERFKIVSAGPFNQLVVKDVDAGSAGRYSLTAENRAGVATCAALIYVRPSNLSRRSELGHQQPRSPGFNSPETTEFEDEEPLTNDYNLPRPSPFVIHVSPRETFPYEDDTEYSATEVPQPFSSVRPPRLSNSTHFQESSNPAKAKARKGCSADAGWTTNHTDSEDG